MLIWWAVLKGTCELYIMHDLHLTVPKLRLDG